MIRHALVRNARGWLGVPWRHLGRNRAGVDCIGLVLLATRESGMDLPDPAPYRREPLGHALLEGLARHGRRVADAAPGDVLLFRMGLYGGHIGIRTDHAAYGVPAVLHAYAPRRHVVEEPIDADMTRALVAAFRFPEG